MDFSLSEEQQMLKDSVARFVRNDYSFARRREILEQGYSKEVWQQFAELGWLCVPFAEQHGGIGGGLADLAVVMEELGKGLVIEPYLATVVLGGGLLTRLGSPTQQETLLPVLLAGDLQLALAYGEADSRFDLSDVQTRATDDGTDWLLNGHKTVVLHGAEADKLLVVARSAGQRYDRDGLSLFLIDSEQDGVTVVGYPTVDGQRAAEIALDQVRVSNDALLGNAGTAWPALNETINHAALALCAEAVGIMDLLLEKTVEYSRTRVQFGQPIARFQALQHRMADMFIECQQARSMLLMAVLQADRGEHDLDRLTSAAKVRIGRAARKIGQEAVQIHGGIAVTEEFDVGHYFKRLTTISQYFGSTDWHLERYVSLSANC